MLNTGVCVAGNARSDPGGATIMAITLKIATRAADNQVVGSQDHAVPDAISMIAGENGNSTGRVDLIKRKRMQISSLFFLCVCVSVVFNEFFY